jgi:hypothetical protein
MFSSSAVSGIILVLHDAAADFPVSSLLLAGVALTITFSVLGFLANKVGGNG